MRLPTIFTPYKFFNTTYQHFPQHVLRNECLSLEEMVSHLDSCLNSDLRYKVKWLDFLDHFQGSRNENPGSFIFERHHS